MTTPVFYHKQKLSSYLAIKLRRRRSIFLALFLAATILPAISEAGETATNRLINEKSPYLLKHATNPIDWYPWGEEPFARARGEDKPIFLSIGYSTCHWCNVMEEESFSDPEVAARMNEVFISIKVDREERPDIDQIYMAVCQMFSTTCGWPLTVFMTSDKEPFFVGTYFPKENRFGRPGLITLAEQMKKLWREEREGILKSAKATAEALLDNSTQTAGPELDKSHLTAAYRELAAHFDHDYAGFGRGTKFPKSHNLMFLLRYWKRTGEAAALAMVEKTLDAMRNGGIYDQIGFGFHRYSTDPVWLVPHFEKMLYDQALLAMVYIEAYQATGKKRYARTAKEVLGYVTTEMTSPEGCFYSAESADSEGEEGKFYLWRQPEIESVLDGGDSNAARKIFHLDPQGNFIDPVMGQKTGANILHLKPGTALPGNFDTIRTKLLQARNRRPRPEKDDKILTDWNGLMIAAFARAARVLHEPGYATAANRAADFVLNRMRDSNGMLFHRWRDGQAGVRATATDYAFFIWGLIELFELNYRTDRIEAALALNHDFIDRFWDSHNSGFFFTAHEEKSVLIRMKDFRDRALPSTNSVAMLNLLRLSRLTGNPELEEKASRMSATFSREIAKSPADYTMFMTALDFAVGPTHEVVVVGKPQAEDTRIMLQLLGEKFLPETVVLFRPAGENDPPILRYASFLKFMSALDGKATAYVCTDFKCEFPTTSVDIMLDALQIGTPTNEKKNSASQPE